MVTGSAWQPLFPALAAGDPATRALIDGAQTLDIPPDQPMFHAGAPCHNYVLVLSGSVRIQVIGEGGREAVLYRVLPGHACVLTPAVSSPARTTRPRASPRPRSAS